MSIEEERDYQAESLTKYLLIHLDSVGLEIVDTEESTFDTSQFERVKHCINNYLNIFRKEIL